YGAKTACCNGDGTGVPGADPGPATGRVEIRRRWGLVRQPYLAAQSDRLLQCPNRHQDRPQATNSGGLPHLPVQISHASYDRARECVLHRYGNWEPEDLFIIWGIFAYR